MMAVVPPTAAARVPEVKSSETRTAPTGRWRWVWASMPPGTTSFPVASWTSSPGRGWRLPGGPVAAMRPSGPVSRSPSRSPSASTRTPPLTSTGWPTSPPSWPEPPRPAGEVGPGRPQVHTHPLALLDDQPPPHHDMAGPAVGAEDQPGQGLRHIGQVLCRPDHQVGGGAGPEVAQLGPPEARRPPLGPQAQGLLRAQGPGPPGPQAGQVQGLADLGEKGPGLVGGGAVHAEAHRRSRPHEVGDGADARAQAAIGAGAVGDAGASCSDPPHLGLVQVYAVGEPDVGPQPTQVLHHVE